MTPSASAPLPGPAPLDLRELPPPEPLQRALEAVAQLAPGGRLAIRTRFRPAHLLDQLDARGCGHETTALGDAGWHTLIWRREAEGR